MSKLKSRTNQPITSDDGIEDAVALNEETNILEVGTNVEVDGKAKIHELDCEGNDVNFKDAYVDFTDATIEGLSSGIKMYAHKYYNSSHSSSIIILCNKPTKLTYDELYNSASMAYCLSSNYNPNVSGYTIYMFGSSGGGCFTHINTVGGPTTHYSGITFIFESYTTSGSVASATYKFEDYQYYEEITEL